MLKLRLIAIGRSVGVVLPQEVLSALNVDKGDSIFLTAEQDGFRIARFDPQVEKAMASARKVMRRRKSALRDMTS